MFHILKKNWLPLLVIIVWFHEVAPLTKQLLEIHQTYSNSPWILLFTMQIISPHAHKNCYVGQLNMFWIEIMLAFKSYFSKCASYKLFANCPSCGFALRQKIIRWLNSTLLHFWVALPPLPIHCPNFSKYKFVNSCQLFALCQHDQLNFHIIALLGHQI